MPIFAYIWALWQTKIGKVIICIIIGYAIILLLGWWLLPIIAVLVAILLIGDLYSRKKSERFVKEEKLRQEKEHRKQLETTKTDLEDFMREHPMAVGNTCFNENRYRYRLYWLMYEYPEGRKVEVYQNKYFRLQFGIASDYDGMIIRITNISDVVILVDWASTEIYEDTVYIDGIKHNKYTSGGIIKPGDSTSKKLIPAFLLEMEREEKMFDRKNMDIFDIEYHLLLKITIEGNIRNYNFKVVSQKKVIEDLKLTS